MTRGSFSLLTSPIKFEWFYLFKAFGRSFLRRWNQRGTKDCTSGFVSRSLLCRPSLGFDALHGKNLWLWRWVIYYVITSKPRTSDARSPFIVRRELCLTTAKTSYSSLVFFHIFSSPPGLPLEIQKNQVHFLDPRFRFYILLPRELERKLRWQWFGAHTFENVYSQYPFVLCVLVLRLH